MPGSEWYKNAIFYEIYLRAFFDKNGDGIGDLQGLIQKLDYIKELGVDCIWLLPICPSPLRDDGYDVSDYCNIHPDYGTLGDFRELIQKAHAVGLRIIMDLVPNHTSDQHPWFQSARSDAHSPYRDYYVWSDNDKKYSQARIIFLDTEKSNWTWDPVAGQYFWHRFYSFQPDLNFDNPAVQEEILKVMDFWLGLGIDGFRVDAVPYLFEREGTNCENLPETHAFLKIMRRFVAEKYPGRILLCEANQWPEEVRDYFGEGDEFQMAFHFPLMPRIFMALRRGSHLPITQILARTPEIPAACQWATFLRNHDELTLEMVSPQERQWMWQQYAPEPEMRLNLGIRRRLAPLLDNDRRKIDLAFSLLFSLPGSPILYYGDEIGMGDNVTLSDRRGVRTPMQWDDTINAGFSTSAHLFSPLISSPAYTPKKINATSQISDGGSLWHAVQKMIQIRKEQLALGMGNYRTVDCRSEKVLAFTREFIGQRVLSLNNLSGDRVTVSVPLDISQKDVVDILAKDEIGLTDFRRITLQPFEFHWFRI